MLIGLFLAALAECGEEQRRIIIDCYERHKQGMYTIAYGVLHDSHYAEDAVHNTFLRVLKNGHTDKLRDPASGETKSYLYKAVKNCSIDIQRSIHAEPSACDEYIQNYPVYADYEYAELVLTVSRAAAAMTRENRIILYMKFYHDLSTQAIADATGLSPGAVEHRVHNIRKKLSKAIRDGGANDASSN